MKHKGVHFNCEQCNFKGKTKTIVKQHVAVKHEGVLHNCNQWKQLERKC